MSPIPPLAGTANESAVNIETLMAESDKSSSEARKSDKLNRLTKQEKVISLLQNNIGKLKEQQDKMGKSGWFSFVVDTVMSIAQIAVNMFPGAGQVASAAIGIAKNMLVKLNPFQKAAQDAEMDAQVLQKQASIGEKFLERAEGKISQNKESEQIQAQRMEKALENMQRAREVLVRA